jgi:hypothetical protein
MSTTELDLIEQQEADALKEQQRLRREQRDREKAESEAAEAAKAAALLPAVEVANVISTAILSGKNADVFFADEAGDMKRALVEYVGVRVSKEQTAEMRAALNLGGVRAFDVIVADGFNGLKNFWKPGKSTCMDDKGFQRLFRALLSMETKTGRMTVSAYEILTPVFKLMNRRRKP